MNLYGDRGNVIALRQRCAWRGIDFEEDTVTCGGSFRAKDYDLFFFGGGQDQEQVTVSRDLQQGKGPSLVDAVNDGAALLAVCGGYQLLGSYFRSGDGTDIPGCGLFHAHTIAGPARHVGNVVAEAQISGHRSLLVGFENHSGCTYLDGAPPSSEQTRPLATVVVGNGNNGQDRTEGAHYRGAIGTYLHGPILPKNPWLADWLLQVALRRRMGPDYELPLLDDTLELDAQGAVRDAVSRRGNRRTSIR